MTLSWLRRLVRPTAPEPLPLTHLRRAARIEAFLVPVLALINLSYWYLRRHEPGDFPAAANATLAIDLGGLAVCQAINLWILFGQASEPQCRRGAAAATMCLVFTTLVATWASGTPTNAPAAQLGLIIGARLYYDARIGLWTLVVATALHLGLLGLMGTGVLPPHLERMAWSTQPMTTTWLAWCGARIAIFYTFAWVVASMIANGFREGQHALRRAQDARERLRAQVVGLRQLGHETVAGTEAAEVALGRLSGTTLAGVYELQEVLGRGGMGEVYQGVRLVDGKDVAIKVLHAALGGDPRMLDRFRREADLAARLPGHHVPAVLEYGRTDDGHHFIAMELLIGEDLGAYLRRRGRLPADELVPLIDELAQALDAAHACGIVHRDLKPNNVFLAGTGRGAPAVKLLDFGIARLYDAAATIGATQVAVLGTPGFLAPEQARGEQALVGPVTDVFALGAVIYRALTGRHAFPSRALASAVFESVYHHPAPPSSQVSGLASDVDLVLAIALAKAPADRYARATELAAELRAAVVGRLAPASRARAAAIIAAQVRLPVGDAATVASPVDDRDSVG